LRPSLGPLLLAWLLLAWLLLAWLLLAWLLLAWLLLAWLLLGWLLLPPAIVGGHCVGVAALIISSRPLPILRTSLRLRSPSIGGSPVVVALATAARVIRSDEVGGRDLDAVEPAGQRLHRVDRVVLARHAGDLAARDLVVKLVLVRPAAPVLVAFSVAALLLLLFSSSSASAAIVPAVPAVRHRGVHLAEDVDPVNRVILPGLAGDGRP